MKYDIIVSGVGGQGVLSIAAIIAASALRQGLRVKQSEEHGMAQRGGAVIAHLRLADEPVFSSLIPRGRADMVLSLEPLESLRYVPQLHPEGMLLTASEPTVNIPDYPDLGDVLNAVQSLPHSHLVDAHELARAAGSARAVNMVMVGAASTFVPVGAEAIEAHILERYASKSEKVLRSNLKAFRAGRDAIGRHATV